MGAPYGQPASRVIAGYLLTAAFFMGVMFGVLLEGAYRDGWRLRSPVERIVPAAAPQ